MEEKMVNKLFRLGILAIISIYAIAVFACSTGGESDTWSNVTNLDQLDGIWKSTYSQKNMAINEAVKQLAILQGVMEFPFDVQAIQMALPNDLKVDSVTDITLTINATQKTQAMSVTSKETFYSKNIFAFWIMLKIYLENFEDERVTVTTNDITHTVTMTYDNPTTPLSEEDITTMLDSGLQINQSGTKIKMPADSLVQGSPELIFEKQ
jgi:hypothetical protein